MLLHLIEPILDADKTLLVGYVVYDESSNRFAVVTTEDLVRKGRGKLTR